MNDDVAILYEYEGQLKVSVANNVMYSGTTLSFELNGIHNELCVDISIFKQFHLTHALDLRKYEIDTGN